MAKKEKLSLAELLDQALVKDADKPYAVPVNWVWVNLGSVIRVSSGNGLTSSKMNADGSIPVYGGNGITGTHDLWNIDDTTIVIGRVGFYCGCVHLIMEKAWVTDNALIVYFQKQHVHIKYLYWLLNNTNLRQNDSSTAQPVISGSKIYSLSIPICPLPEQRRIVALIESLFEKLDRAKELAQNALDSFENRKSAILHKAFTGELTRKWRKENGVEFERDWVENTLCELCSINPRKIDTKDLNDNLKVTFVPMSAVSDVLGIIELPQIKTLAEVKKGYTNFSNGDVIFAKITPCMENGKSAIVEILVNNIGFGSTEFHVLRCSEKLLNRYLYHIVRWQMFRDEAKQVMTGAVGQQRVSKNFLEEYLLNVPPLHEQKEITRILDNLLESEQKAKELCDVIDKIDLMKKAILARAFRGELSTNNPDEESALELLKEVLKEKGSLG